MEGDLKSILDGTDTGVEQVETEAPAETQEAVETVQAPEQGEQPQATPAQTATPAVEPDEIKGLKAALTAERRKRQELEQRAHTQQFDPQRFYQDPQEIASFVEQRQLATAINMSREFAREQYADYDDMEALFEEEAMRNPALIAELRQHPAPALFAYKTAKSLKTMREAQDGSLEARLRAEIEQKVRAELTQQQRPAVPTDLSGARSAPVQTAVAEESLDSILKR